MAMTRHLTATGFLVQGDCVALHWHRKVQAWLPAGGHVEENEDPVQAMLREVLEETGVAAFVVQTAPEFPFTYPPQVPSPITILVENVSDDAHGEHQHIDMIYACRPLAPDVSLPDGWRWTSSAELADKAELPRDNGAATCPPEDVLVLALHVLSQIR